MKPIFVLLALSLLPLASAQQAPGTATPTQGANQGSQDPNNTTFDDEEDQRRFWQASFPGGEYLVALDRITAISKHQYLLDGTLIINEVTIDTVGDSLVRIYHIEPAANNGELTTAKRLIERGNELLDQAGQRTGSNLHEMVQKQYPTTTHSKIVEYRVRNLETLNALYRSVETAWTKGRGRHFRVRE